MDPDEARDALKAVGAAREGLARSMDCPLWRHAAFGAVMAGLVAANLVPQPFHAALFVVSMAATLWLMRWDRSRYGTFVNGWRRGRTLPLSLGLFAALLGLVFLARHVRSEDGVTAAGLLTALAAFGLGTAMSVIWQKVYVAELRSGTPA
ncbi:MAG: hypothetical protein ACKOQ3_14370 [Novosphingobium sp.]